MRTSWRHKETHDKSEAWNPISQGSVVLNVWILVVFTSSLIRDNTHYSTLNNPGGLTDYQVFTFYLETKWQSGNKRTLLSNSEIYRLVAPLMQWAQDSVKPDFVYSMDDQLCWVASDGSTLKNHFVSKEVGLIAVRLRVRLGNIRYL